MMRILLQTPARTTVVLGMARALNTAAFTFISKITRRVFIGALIAIATVFIAFLYVSEVFSVRVAAAAPQFTAGKVYLGTPAVANAATLKPQMLEMHIANNGLMLLRGATVISNARGTLRVGMTWGSADFIWTITTDSGTKFLTSKGVGQAIGDIAVGDTVTVTGMLKSSGPESVVAADYVRE
ncbi:MAG: hypothetical protein Q7S50_02735 [bacterium]|nr:hypothetical protein [bacterium]